MRTIGTAFLLAACLSACGSKGSEGPQANSGNAAAAAPGSELSTAWLVGRWHAGEDGACAPGDTYFDLEPNGRYAFMEEQGRWSLEGNQLTIEVTQASSDSGIEAGQRSVTTVRRLGDNEAEFTREGGTPIRVTRCR